MTTWERVRPFLSYIKAAVEAGIPPKQVIFDDPSHKEYDFWDLRLIKAYHFAEAFVREGIPVWWDESDEVFFDVERRVSRSRAATQRAERSESGKDKEPPHGRYYVPIPRVHPGKEFPSFEDWTKETERKNGKK